MFDWRFVFFPRFWMVGWLGFFQEEPVDGYPQNPHEPCRDELGTNILTRHDSNQERERVASKRRCARSVRYDHSDGYCHWDLLRCAMSPMPSLTNQHEGMTFGLWPPLRRAFPELSHVWLILTLRKCHAGFYSTHGRDLRTCWPANYDETSAMECW